MRSKNKKRKPPRWKTKLGLPDLDNAKAAVLASLHSPESQRSYRHAIDELLERSARREDRRQICEECREGNEHQREL
jgi:hypothetical protein